MRTSLVKKTSSCFVACSVVLLLITAWSTKTGSPDALGRKILKASGQPPKSRVLCVIGVQVTALTILLPHLACRICEFAGMVSSGSNAQTGFTRPGASLQYNYQQRRTALRQSWFPADQESLDQLQRETSFVLRFVIGHSKLYSAEQELSSEARRHGGFLRLPMQACTCYLTPIMLSHSSYRCSRIVQSSYHLMRMSKNGSLGDCLTRQRGASQEDYGSLTTKTLSFLRTVVAAWDADYIVKASFTQFCFTAVRWPLHRSSRAVVRWRRNAAAGR